MHGTVFQKQIMNCFHNVVILSSNLTCSEANAASCSVGTADYFSRSKAAWEIDANQLP
jgi:phosphoribosyl-AMP cyclohydrolase